MKDKISEKIIYGCMNLSGGWNKEPITKENKIKAREIIETTLELGIKRYDHADIYMYGKSELLFGEVIKDLAINREKIFIQSKCGIRFANDIYNDAPHRYDLSYSHIINSVDSILKRLNTEYLDRLLLHRVDLLLNPEEISKAFDELYSAGKVRSFGVSNMSGNYIDYLQNFINQPISSNQVELNLLHNGLIMEAMSFNIENENFSYAQNTLPYCIKNKIEIQAWSPLAKGKLINEDGKSLNNRELNISKKISELSEKYHISKEAIALAWLFKHHANIKAVIGTTNIDRIKNCCESVKVELSREDWYSLTIISREKGLP